MAPTTPPKQQKARKTARHEWETPTIARVRLYKQDGLSTRDIEAKTGVPRRSQYRMFALPNDRRPGKARRGRPPIINSDTVQKMEDNMKGRYQNRLDQAVDLMEEYTLPCTSRTVKKSMNREGIYKFKAAQKQWLMDAQIGKRLEFALEHRDWPEWKWKMVYWSDELHFHMNSRAAEWVWRRRGQRYQEDTIQKKHKTGTSQLHAWAMISWNYKSKLLFYGHEEDETANITMDYYTRKMLPIVRRRQKELELRGESMIFQEDNDSGHGTKSLYNIAREYKDESGLDYIDDWPPNSPDLSPIENVWRILKQRVKRHYCTSVIQLKRAIQQEWNRITFKDINKLILGRKAHMQKRLDEVIERKGLQTQF